MRSKGRVKKAIIWTGALLALLIVLVLAMPLWFPWVLRPVGKHYGLSYSDYERHGYGRLELRSALYTNRSVRLEARTIEAFVPTVWAWKHFRGDTTATFGRAANWRLTISPTTNAPARGPVSVHAQAEKIATLLGKIDLWIPNASLTNGVVQIKEQIISIGEFDWAHGKLRSTVQLSRFTKPFRIEGAVSAGTPWTFQGRYEELRAEIQAIHSASNLAIAGRVFVQTNRFDVRGEFARGGVLPKRAIVECSSFSVPGRFVKLESYSDLKGAVSLVWNGTNFTTEAQASASPPENSKLPPIDVALKADGDLRHANVQRLKILAPGLQAALSTNVTIPFATGAPPAILKITGNLREQPWVPLEGIMQGEIVLSASRGPALPWAWPRCEFTLTATNFGTRRFKTDLFAISGEAAWPLVTVQNGRATVGSNGVARFRTVVDLATKEVRTSRVDYEGPLPSGLLPMSYSSEAISVAAELAGPFTNLHHNAEVQIRGLKSGQLKPIDAAVAAEGHGRSITAKASVRAGASIAQLALAAEIRAGTNELRINELSLSSGGQVLLALEAPVALRVSSEAVTGGPLKHEVNLSPMRLKGGERQINLEASVKWPDQGNCRGTVHGIALDDFADFLDANWRGVRIEDLQFATEWQQGPMNLLLAGNGAYAQGPGFTAKGEVRADANGVLLSNITVSSQSAPVVSAHGFVPIAINPAAGTNFIAWRPGETLNLKANMQPDAQFWQRIRDLTGIEVVGPELKVDVSGSWSAPTGWVHASVARANLHQTNRPLPAVENLQLSAELNAQRLRLDKLQFLVEKQPVLVTAELPLDAQFYQALAQRKLPDWRRGSARVLIRHAPVAAFTRYLPKVLAPIGGLTVDVAMRPGAKLDGQIALQGAISQPLGPFGAVRDINTHLQLKGQTITLDRFSATIGGEPLQAAGTLDVSGPEWMHGQIPPFRLKINGRSIPLVRQPEVIIRSDLDLTLVHGRTNAPVISGLINLRDSFYTSDLESLIPGSVIKPSRRPPYFSVEAEPMASWKLDCQVRGHDFMKLRTPFFKGTVSADFKLEGTLREPLATGEAHVSEGQVNFPFGTLDMKQGIVSVTSANPYQPAIYATARSRRYGYDITMEVTGSGDKPLLQFSSVPSLASEQILLLLTAGEIPRDELAFSPQQKAQRFAIFLGQRVLAKLGLGGGAERLTIRSGEDISESGRTTYDVEYKLDKNWSLVGQYDRFNAFNLSVKRRIYSR